MPIRSFFRHMLHFPASMEITSKTRCCRTKHPSHKNPPSATHTTVRVATERRALPRCSPASRRPLSAGVDFAARRRGRCLARERHLCARPEYCPQHPHLPRWRRDPHRYGVCRGFALIVSYVIGCLLSTLRCSACIFTAALAYELTCKRGMFRPGVPVGAEEELMIRAHGALAQRA